MSAASPAAAKKHYTVEEANATLPLLRSILRDVTGLAGELRELHRRILRLQDAEGLDAAHAEELQALTNQFDGGQDRMHDYEQELAKLSVELKDYFTGLVDFRSMQNGREVYLCWRLGEPEVAHWHDLDAGFAGRQRLKPASGSR